MAELWRSDPNALFRPIWIPVLVAGFYQAATSLALEESPGKLLFRLTVLGPDGHTASPLRRLARAGGMVLSGLTFGLGWLIAAIVPTRRALHDLVSDTWVHSEGSSS